MKRDVETTFLGDNDSAAQTSGVNANATRGLLKWVSSTQQGHYPVDLNYLTPATSIDATTVTADYKDSTITSVLKSMYDQHGDSEADIDIWCGSTWKNALGHSMTFYNRTETNMVNVRSWNQQAGDNVILGKVDVLETDFGMAKVRVSNFINTLGDPTSAASKLLAVAVPNEMIEARFSEQPNKQDLAKTGRGEKFLVTATGALVVLNPLPFGKWTPAS